MYCPSCGVESVDQTKFCTKCGVNLRRVKGVMGKGGANLKEEDNWRSANRLESFNNPYKTPEEKRFNEIKAGVITSSVGLGLMIFLNLLFDAVANAAGGGSGPNILRSLWAVGLIPFIIGLGIVFNGLFVSKRIVALKRQQELATQQPPLFSAPDTLPETRFVERAQIPVSDYSIIEATTTKLREPASASPEET